MREKILDLLSGKKIDEQPAFSGLIHITEYLDMTCLRKNLIDHIFVHATVLVNNGVYETCHVFKITFMRQKILALLSGKKTNEQPAFNGLIHITEY